MILSPLDKKCDNNENKKLKNQKCEAEKATIKCDFNNDKLLENVISTNETLVKEVIMMKNLVAEKDIQILEQTGKYYEERLKNVGLVNDLENKNILIQKLEADLVLLKPQTASFDLLGSLNDNGNCLSLPNKGA